MVELELELRRGYLNNTASAVARLNFTITRSIYPHMVKVNICVTICTVPSALLGVGVLFVA